VPGSCSGRSLSTADRAVAQSDRTGAEMRPPAAENMLEMDVILTFEVCPRFNAVEGSGLDSS